MEELKKKNKILIVIVVILVSIILGFGGYMAYKAMMPNSPVQEETNKDKTKKDEEKQEEEKEELSSEEVDSLLKKATEITNKLGYKYSIDNTSSITNQELLKFAIKQNSGKEYVSKEEMDNTIKEYFGNEIKVNHENIECFVTGHPALYIFDGTNYKYNPDHGGHGGEGSKIPSVHYVSGEKTKTTLTINYKIAYSNYCGDTCMLYAYYPTYNSEEALVDYSNSDDIKEFTDEEYEKVKDKIPVTTFKYEIKDGSYNLKSITVK